MNENGRFSFVTPRETVEVHLSDGRVLSGPRGASVGEFLKVLEMPGEPPIVGAVVNSELRELKYPIVIDSRVRPVTMGEADGMRFYRRSLIFLLEAAFEELFPRALLTVDHSVSSGGYFCQVYHRPPLTNEELAQLEARMRVLVEEDISLERSEVPIQDAIEFFRKKGYEDKVRLLKHRKKDHLVLYRLGDHRDYHHGYMVPSTGVLCWFGLTPAEDGFTLRFPRRHRPMEILPLPDYSTLLDTFREYGDWLQRLGIASVGALDDAIKAGRHREVILVSEALHEQRISDIASQIAAKAKDVRVVLIAGPSSSGKTTFSRRLSIQLLTRGISPFAIEMDNYFVDRDKTPLDENGELDFESIDAVSRKRLGDDLSRLIAGKRVKMPRYDFLRGKSVPGDEVQLLPGQIVILEGIHGLNPELIPIIPERQTFRVYASALTQLNLDSHNRVSTTDTRLIRRIVRDARDRGYSALETINRWESVRRGEKRYIFPYQEYANSMFNTALVYELSALRPLAEPLLRQVPLGTDAYIEAKRLLNFLSWFLPVDHQLIPDNSILREFIGGSILKEFRIWQS
jgi:uridine kinase